MQTTQKMALVLEAEIKPFKTMNTTQITKDSKLALSVRRIKLLLFKEFKLCIPAYGL